MQSFGVPQGMRDILIDESRKRTILQEKLLHYMQCCGFNRIETPLFEYYEMFTGDISPVDEESTIKVIDRDGRVVVLRPDMTIPTVRVVATKLKGQRKPLKLFYMGNVYRGGKRSKVAGREFTQIGAEIFGSTGKWLDLEIMAMAKEAFKAAGVSEYKIDIGHIGIIKGIFEELGLSPDKEADIIDLINRKNLVELEEEVAALDIDARYKDIICKLPLAFGKPEEVFGDIESLIVNSTVKEAADYLMEVCGKCRSMGLDSKLIIDLGMTGNMKYYTGMIFKSYAQGSSEVVISGGRYDDLLGELGVNTTAAGFAIYIDSMLEAAAKANTVQPEERKVLAVFNEDRFIEALEHSEKCREKGITVNLISSGDLPDPKDYGGQYGYKEIVIFD
ncbi:MAG TPA: ATP phosphoribosyltransferase regulatory subunit [Negativicutes bacterium]|nr:ATP phosphoribosyltransferase regulatory subunit [Negativicutes bacterium]